MILEKGYKYSYERSEEEHSTAHHSYNKVLEDEQYHAVKHHAIAAITSQQ